MISLAVCLKEIWYYQSQPNKAQPKNFSSCDEIMLSNEITNN